MNIFDITKRVSAFGAISVWLILIYKIIKSGGGFHNQLPKCLFATMTIFTLLTLIYKAIEYLQSKDLSKFEKESNSQRKEDSK